MAVEDPGTLQVTCDGCGKQEDMDTTEYGGDPPSWGVDSSTIEQNGWTVSGNSTYCPDCKDEAGEEEDG